MSGESERLHLFDGLQAVQNIKTYAYYATFCYFVACGVVDVLSATLLRKLTKVSIDKRKTV